MSGKTSPSNLFITRRNALRVAGCWQRSIFRDFPPTLSDHVDMSEAAGLAITRIADEIVSIQLNRPTSLNALSLADIANLSAALEKHADERVIILSGAGKVRKDDSHQVEASLT